jgi:hypothetical protein
VEARQYANEVEIYYEASSSSGCRAFVAVRTIGSIIDM